MADKETAYYLDAAEQGFRRDAGGAKAPVIQKKLRFAEFEITLETGFITAADNYVLGPLLHDAEVIPNLSFLVGVSGSVQGVFSLEKVSASGATPTALGGSVTLATDGTAVALGAASGGSTGFPTVDAGEYLQLTIGTATALANGDVVKLVVAYLVNDAYGY